MITKHPMLNFVAFAVLLGLFLWAVVRYSDMPIVVGAAGVMLILFLTAAWIPFRRAHKKKRQKPGDPYGHPNEWQ